MNQKMPEGGEFLTLLSHLKKPKTFLGDKKGEKQKEKRLPSSKSFFYLTIFIYFFETNTLRACFFIFHPAIHRRLLEPQI